MRHRNARIEPRFTRLANSTTVASSDPRVMDFFGTMPSSSGQPVTETSAMLVSAAYACTRIIASAISSMPVDVFRRVPGGTRQRINEDHGLWWLLNEQPHTRWTASGMWNWLVKSELLRGDGFALIQRDRNGTPISLQPLRQSGLGVELRGGRLAYYYTDDAGQARGVDQDDMIHIPGFGYDGIRGMSAIQWGARQAIGIGLATDDFSGKFFSSGAMVRHALKVPGKMDAGNVDRLREAYGERYGSGMADGYRPMVLTEGVEVEELSLNAEDSQLLEARRFQVDDIARAFGVPAFMIGQTENSTTFGAGIEHMSLGFVKYTLQGRLTTIEQELNRKLFRTAGTFVKFNVDELLRGDSAARAKYLREMVGGSQGPGIITADEARMTENYAPIGGDAAKLYDPRTAAIQPKPASGDTANA